MWGSHCGEGSHYWSGGSHDGGEGPFKRGSSVRRGFYYGVGVPLKGSHSGEGSHYGGRFPLWGGGPIMGGFHCVCGGGLSMGVPFWGWGSL